MKFLGLLAGCATVLGLSLLFGSSKSSTKNNSSKDDDEFSSMMNMTRGTLDAIFGNDKSSSDASYNAGYDAWSDD